MKKTLLVIAALLALCLAFTLGGYLERRTQVESVGVRLDAELHDAISELRSASPEDTPAASAYAKERLIRKLYCAYRVSNLDPTTNTEKQISAKEFEHALYKLWSSLELVGDGLQGREAALADALEARNAKAVEEIARQIALAASQDIPS